jgi:flagellar basal body rod protein FlgG
MLAIQADGKVQYTRDGALKVSPEKFLVTQRGFRVLDDRGQPIKLGNEGLVHISPNGEVIQGTQEVAKLGVYTGNFTKEGNNLWSTPQPTRVTEPSIAIASLEGSNVDAVATMVDLIKINRHFEMSQKSIHTQDDMTGKLFEILKR